MKVKSLLLTVFLMLASSAFAQHKNTATWTGSVDEATNPSIFYNVYAAQGLCPPTGLPANATKLVSTLAMIHTYTDTNVTVGVPKCYYVKTAVTVSGVTTESPLGSNTASGTPPLADATNLVVSSQ